MSELEYFIFKVKQKDFFKNYTYDSKSKKYLFLSLFNLGDNRLS